MGETFPTGSSVEQACILAEVLLRASRRSETRTERRRRLRMARLLEDPAGKRFVLGLTDRVVRVREAHRAARLFRALVEEEGVPAFARPVDRLATLVGAHVAPRAPRIVLPLIRARLRRESAGVVLPAEDSDLRSHIAGRRAQGMRVNVNVLGEAVLGEREALRRRDAVLAQLAKPETDYVSVKVSAVCSRLNVLAFDAEVDRIVDRLRPLYVEAQRHVPPKFVNLDMEEYRDLHLTAAAFRKLLDEPGLRSTYGGIVLQAYLPDSLEVMAELCEWAQTRRAGGGGRIKVRLVKGANLAMEQVDAELHGWEQAPYETKAEVDANFKRLLDVALDDAYARAVTVGVGTHNLFDLAWALVRARERNALDRVEIEMLEGMADPLARAARTEAGGLLLYAPVVRRGDFESAIAYLVRRLDENTARENFLRAVFSLEPGSAEWQEQRARFEAAVRDRAGVVSGPRRRQDRRVIEPPVRDVVFRNEPDTDWSRPGNRAWIEGHLADEIVSGVTLVPAVVGGREVTTEPRAPARVVGDLLRSPQHALADIDLVERAVGAARQAGKEWSGRSASERRDILLRVADVIAAHRGDTLVAMARDAGKTMREGDAEVSEACDFARYYASAGEVTGALARDGIEFEPLGTVVVASPWNFPYAIPAGGVLAALAAGNAVILKPAPETVFTGWLLARHCWEAGVPKDVLQFLPCPDDDVGRRLITHPEVDAVILTGSSETARMFLDWKPSLRLFAETSGKNAVVVTAAADLDAAVRDIVQSAFGHAGQKCSAASLAIVEAPVYDDPAFRGQLADAVESLVTGPAWDLRTDVPPLVRPAEAALLRALTALDAGEEWLVEPRQLDPDGHLWSPGVKLGVRPQSSFHTTECFGPVLGVMRAADLDQAIEWQNATAFGLTGGIHSLDSREVELWVDRVEVGNAYVNRGITGAIVGRQPFGGWKRSVVGGLAKAGGPNYVLGLGRTAVTRRPTKSVVASSFEAWWNAEFSRAHDPAALRSERNIFRYRPLPNGVLLRLGARVSDDDVEVALLAARTAGVAVEVSTAVARDLPDGIPSRVETEDELAGRLSLVRRDRMRVLGEVGDHLRRAASAQGLACDDAPIVPHGRIELLRWVREQAISETRHRHGNLLDDDTESTRPAASIDGGASR